MYLDLYGNANPAVELNRFQEPRNNNLEVLRGLPTEAAGRTALHRAAGEITLGQMLHEWTLHDLGHI